MKYCFNYNKYTEKAQNINKADEWTIEYNSKDNTLLEFLELHRDKRINIYFKKEDVNEKFLKELCEKYNNVYIKLDFQYMLNNKPDFRFFYDLPINDIDLLIGILKLGVTDVYVAENLCFELDKITEIVHLYDASVRAYPNVAQSRWKDTPALKKFFIRPEDLKEYEKYIDVIEFYNVDKQIDIYYDIYENKKQWFGKLNEIILDFDSEIDNRYIISRFAEMRIRCNKKCFKGKHCRRCNVIENLSNSLEKSKLIVKKEEK